MAGNRYVIPRVQYFDEAGRPLVGAKLQFYAAGTTTPQDTFSDAALSVANANPVISDSNGYYGDIFLTPTVNYKAVFTKSDDTAIWTADNIPGNAIAAGTVVTASIADLSVTTAKIAANAVTTAKILDDNVTTAKILNDNVTTAKILDANVTGAKLEVGIAAINVSPDDTTEGYLDGKLLAGDNISLTVGSPAGDETLTVDTAFRGALIYLDATNQAIADGGADLVTFTDELYDVGSWADLGAQATRLTVPANVSYVRVTANCLVTSTVSTGAVLKATISRAGTSTYLGQTKHWEETTGSSGTFTRYFNLCTGVLAVSEGDYFGLIIEWIDIAGATGATITGSDTNSATWLSIEAVE